MRLVRASQTSYSDCEPRNEYEPRMRAVARMRAVCEARASCSVVAIEGALTLDYSMRLA